MDPEKTFRAGPVGASVFKNEFEKEGKKEFFYTVNINRVFTDKDGNTKNNNTFRAGDLPRVELVARKAFEYLSLKQ